MDGKAVSGIMLTLLLTSMLTLAFNIQPVRASGTIYIRADGSVVGTDKIQRDGDVYTFTGNIYDSLVVERDNIVVDGAGYTVQGTGSGTGIDLSSRNNVTLKNAEVTNFTYGIYLISSSNNTLAGNTASNNDVGILLTYSTNNTIIGNTAFSNNEYGISLWSSSNNVLAGNTASNNWDGIYLYKSSNNVLTGNTASNNEYNFCVDGVIFSHFNNYVDTSNTVDGKPIYYLIGVADAVYDAKTNAGTIYLINSNNITIKDLTLTKNGKGASFFNTTNSKIENVTASNNAYGIYLDSSSNNTLAGNTASNNVRGIILSSSSNNVLFHNNFIYNERQTVNENSVNTWDDGYPSGGNYWSDYTGTDADGDGIGDTPYIIDTNNRDRYPLMSPWGEIPEEVVPFWMLWWFMAIVVVVIVALAGAVYFLKKRKPPTPTAPTLPTEGTLQKTTQNNNPLSSYLLLFIVNI